MPNHRGHRRAAAPLTRPFMPFPSSFPAVPVRRPENWPVVDSLGPQHPNCHLRNVTYWNAIAVLFTTRIAAQAKTGAALSGPRVMAEPEVSRRKCVKARIAAPTTTKTCIRVLVALSGGRPELSSRRLLQSARSIAGLARSGPDPQSAV